MSPDASAAEIRAAYHLRARELHPDVRAAGREPAAATASMSELNRAYQILGRDGTRREYDRGLLDAFTASPLADDVAPDDDTEPPPSPGARAVGRALTPAGPARMPWKLMGVAALIGTVAVLVTAALADPPSEETPDGVLRVGSCVSIESNGDAREVACTGAGDDRVVALLLPTGADCPPAYATHRDRLGLGAVCVEPAA